MHSLGGSPLGAWGKRAGFGAALAGVVLGMLALTGDPSARAAGTTGGAVTVTTTNVALYRGDCAHVPVVVAAKHDASGTGTWSGEWSVRLDVPGVLDRHYRGFDETKTFKFFKCAGLWRTRDIQVEATWTQFDSLGEPIAIGTTKGHYKITRKPPANTRLKVSRDPYGTTGWRFTGTLLRQGKPFRWEKVSLWYRSSGYWFNYHNTKISGRKGQCSWHTDRDIPTNRYRFQLRYEGDNRSRSARSDVFQLPRR